MAGQIIVSSIKTDNDNSISFLANTGDVIFTANTSHGIPGSYIENGTITSDKLATGGILTVDLGDESVTSLKIANGAISTVDIADGAITNAKLGADVDLGINPLFFTGS